MYNNSSWWSYIEFDEKQAKPPEGMALLRRAAHYARPYWLKTIAMLATIAAVTLVSLVPPLIFRDFIDNVIANKDVGRLHWLAVGLVLVPVVNGALGLLQSHLGAQVGYGIVRDLRMSLFTHLQKMSLRFFTATRSGELMSRLNNDVLAAQDAVTGTLLTLVSNIIAITGTLLVMVSLDWRLTLLSTLLLPVFVLPARRMGRVVRDIVRRQMTTNAEMYALLGETLHVSGALLVKLFGRTDDEVARMRGHADAVLKMGVLHTVVLRGLFLTLSLASAFGTALVFWIGGQMALEGMFTAGAVVAFSFYLGQFYGPLMALTNARVQFVTALVSFERVFEVLDLPVEIEERPGATMLTGVNGEVSFNNVSFSYGTGVAEGEATTHNAKRRAAVLNEVSRIYAPVVLKTRSNTHAEEPGKVKGKPGESSARSMARDKLHPVSNGTHDPRPATHQPYRDLSYALHEISFVARPGQIVAVVGRSGAGKTTLMYLLMRLYDVTGGSVQIDGHDIRDLTLASLTDNIGMVTQEVYLFHDTILANLLYALPEANEEQIEEACRAANIHDFIMSLPDAYNTIVGEHGYRLSGGEKQRLAIARVLLKNPRILVLDEATSNLDNMTEMLIQEALQRLMAGRTSIVIAHRLGTIMAADQILVLDKGRLVEQGTHSELLAREGTYFHLYQTQLRAQAQPYLNPEAALTGS